MTAKLTDQAVSRLPLESARAELLEEIVATTASRGVARPVGVLAPRRRRWLVPAAAAAAIAALAVGTAVYRDGAGSSLDTSAATASPASEKDQRVLVTAPGWRVTSPGTGGGIYHHGEQALEITTAPASLYDGYVEDREHIVTPPAPGTPLTVLGASAQMWAYSDPDDFAVIREVVDGQWMELRGQQMDEATFRSVLDSLRLVSVAEFEQAMPARMITGDERGAAIKQIITGITDASGAQLPGDQLPNVDSAAEDPYQLGTDVAGQYTCAWLAAYVSATASGNTAEADEAVRVLGTARQWPVLQELESEGDYPEVVWDYADEIAAGKQPDGYQGGLGC